MKTQNNKCKDTTESCHQLHSEVKSNYVLNEKIQPEGDDL